MRFSYYVALAVLAVIGVGLAFTFEKPVTDSVQHGYRGTGMVQVYNRLALEGQAPVNRVPEAQPPVEQAGQPASAVYENVKVLGNVDANEFLRLMTAMTEWVSPDNGDPNQGCAYCHNLENMADDTKYTHKVSRRMIQMTQHINTNWKTHVQDTGVTCYTCHRGQNVPNGIWFDGEQKGYTGLVGNRAGQNIPAPAAGLASLPSDPFSPFLSREEEIRVIGGTALPTGNRTSTKQTEWTYSLMMHMSTSLGVNCTYCHNSRSFSQWDQSSPQRNVAWYGIRLARDLNDNFLDPLQPVYPPHRLGPLGDAPKSNCTTCHQGAYKPLYGAQMLKDYPAFALPPAQSAAAPADTKTAATKGEPKGLQ
jgi:photosynthetic reaction center cytochrome c subunit